MFLFLLLLALVLVLDFPGIPRTRLDSDFSNTLFSRQQRCQTAFRMAVVCMIE
jgi:hypothetical protein